MLVPNSASFREQNDCHNPAGPGGGQFCSKGGPGFETFVQQATEAFEKTSRTAAGVSDTSASERKPHLTAEGADLKARATKNYHAVLRTVWEARNKPLDDPEEVLGLIRKLGHAANAGLLPPGQTIWRKHETKFQQTPPAEIRDEMRRFAGELSRRITSKADPISTAAWIEHEFNGRIHPFVDGVGRVSKALAAMVLARANLPLPKYPDRKVMYGAIGGPLAEWETLYRSWFK